MRVNLPSHIRMCFSAFEWKKVSEGEQSCFVSQLCTFLNLKVPAVIGEGDDPVHHVTRLFVMLDKDNGKLSYWSSIVVRNCFCTTVPVARVIVDCYVTVCIEMMLGRLCVSRSICLLLPLRHFRLLLSSYVYLSG